MFKLSTNCCDDLIFQMDNENFYMTLLPDKFFPCKQKHINLFIKIVKMTTNDRDDYLNSLLKILWYLDDQIINECRPNRLSKLKANYKTIEAIHQKVKNK